MGELDEKESAPANAPTATTTPTADVITVDESKETETLLPAVADAKPIIAISETTNSDALSTGDNLKSSTSSTTVTIEKEPTTAEVGKPTTIQTTGDDSDKELEKLLPANDEAEPKGKKPAAVTAEEKSTTASVPSVTKEGREVKPKKIPIGGIKMPGFFTKSKPKTDGDGADGDLLEKPATGDDVDVESGAKNATADAKDVDSKVKDAADVNKTSQSGFFASLRLRNPFAKRQTAQTTNDEDDTLKEVKVEGTISGRFLVAIDSACVINT